MKRGLPTVVVTTERFDAVAKATLRSQRVPVSIVVEIKGNPEFVPDAELALAAETALAQIVERLTTRHSK